jgi:hypothetical protein
MVSLPLPGIPGGWLGYFNHTIIILIIMPSKINAIRGTPKAILQEYPIPRFIMEKIIQRKTRVIILTIIFFPHFAGICFTTELRLYLRRFQRASNSMGESTQRIHPPHSSQ